MQDKRNNKVPKNRILRGKMNIKFPKDIQIQSVLRIKAEQREGSDITSQFNSPSRSCSYYSTIHTKSTLYMYLQLLYVFQYSLSLHSLDRAVDRGHNTVFLTNIHIKQGSSTF